MLLPLPESVDNHARYLVEFLADLLAAYEAKHLKQEDLSSVADCISKGDALNKLIYWHEEYHTNPNERNATKLMLALSRASASADKLWKKVDHTFKTAEHGN